MENKIDKLVDIYQATFSNTFSCVKIAVKFQWNIFPKAQLTVSHAWLKMAYRQIGKKSLYKARPSLSADAYMRNSASMN